MNTEAVKQYKLSMTIPLVIAVFIALLIGGATLQVTWEHNQQNEFHSDEGIHWASWLPFGGIAALVGFVVALPLSVCGVMLIASLKSK